MGVYLEQRDGRDFQGEHEERHGLGGLHDPRGRRHGPGGVALRPTTHHLSPLVTGAVYLGTELRVATSI